MTATHPAGEALVLGQLDPSATTGFDSKSMLRRIGAEPVVGLILQRALVLEVAHAKVGAGVQHHSLFRGMPIRRAWSTLDVGVRLVWGDVDVSRAAANQVYRFHDHVNGELPEPGAAWPDGAAYTAHDASLLLWVWATLVDTAAFAYQRWVRALTEDEKDSYYADMCAFARFFGIPSEMIPVDRPAFHRYYDAVIDGDELQPTPTSRAVVQDVLWFSNWNVPKFAVRPLRVLSIGTLDPRLRTRFDLDLSPRDQKLFDRFDGMLRRYYKLRPGWLIRRLPGIYVTLRRPTIGRSKRHRAGRR